MISKSHQILLKRTSLSTARGCVSELFRAVVGYAEPGILVNMSPASCVELPRDKSHTQIRTCKSMLIGVVGL